MGKPGRVLSYKRLMGMRSWMGSHLSDKIGSIIGHRIDCNGVWALRGQQHMPPGGGGTERTVTCCLSSAFFQFKVNKKKILGNNFG